MVRIGQAESLLVVRVTIGSDAEPETTVRQALDRLMRGGFDDFTYVVEDTSVKFFITQRNYDAFLTALDGAWDQLLAG